MGKLVQKGMSLDGTPLFRWFVFCTQIVFLTTSKTRILFNAMLFCTNGYARLSKVSYLFGTSLNKLKRKRSSSSSFLVQRMVASEITAPFKMLAMPIIWQSLERRFNTSPSEVYKYTSPLQESKVLIKSAMSISCKVNSSFISHFLLFSFAVCMIQQAMFFFKRYFP